MIPTGPGFSRRGLIAAAAGSALLAACGRKDRGADAPKPKARPLSGGPQTIEEAIAGEWRLPEDRARDKFRHPLEALTFWGLKPAMTVVEFWPGAGWYTDILAPFLTATGGKLYAANLQPSDPAATEVLETYAKKIAARKKLYGAVEITAFGPTSGPVAPAGTADMALFLRNIHNWMAGGIIDKAFRDAFAALKPGGVLGVEEHRADPGGVQDAMAASGYVQQAYVIEVAQEAGFILDKTSEINANPKDDRDHPFGVWTLPPTRLSAPRGEPATPGFDHSPYDAIGESDRMTLRFLKPA